MTPVNIMSGFRKCGIYFLNPGAVKDYETAPSILQIVKTKNLILARYLLKLKPFNVLCLPTSECSVVLDSGSDITDPAAKSRASPSSSVRNKTSVASSSNTDYLTDASTRKNQEILSAKDGTKS